MLVECFSVRCDWSPSWLQQCFKRATWCRNFERGHWNSLKDFSVFSGSDFLVVLKSYEVFFFPARGELKMARGKVRIFPRSRQLGPGCLPGSALDRLSCLPGIGSITPFLASNQPLEVLKRMCRGLYRYPDPEAAELAKRTLQEISQLGCTSSSLQSRSGVG